MPRYHLHVYDAGGITTDEEGHDFADLAAAEKAALMGIRSMLADEVNKGKLSLGGRIAIMDSANEVVLVVPFSQAVTIDTTEHGP